MTAYKKYIIGEVLDNDTDQRSTKFGYRVGRECFIVNLEIDSPMVVKYPDGKMFYTSVVKEIDENEYSLWIVTNNRTYRFDDMILIND